MRRRSLFLFCSAVFFGGASLALRAQDLATTCQASSSYDLTLRPAEVLFDRPQPAPFHVELHDGAPRTDGSAVALRAEDQDRLALFESELRALAPRAKTVARNGVDLLAQAVLAEDMQCSREEVMAAVESMRRSETQRRRSELTARIKEMERSGNWHDALRLTEELQQIERAARDRS